MNHTKTRSMVQLAMFSAIICMLAFIPYLGYIQVPFLAIQATTIHIPVIVGSILLGPKCGGFLGFVFGLTSMIRSTTHPSLTSFCFSPFVEIAEGMGGSPLALIVCFAPRIACGITPYYVHKWLLGRSKNREKGRKYALLAAGVSGSLTNTILVMSMIYLFFGHSYAAACNIPFEAVLGVVLSVVCINGTVEALIAAILSSAVSSAVMKARILR